MSVTVADIGDEIKVSYQPNANEDFRYIGLEHVEPQSLHLSGYGSSLEVGSTKYKFSKGDILLGTLRPYFKKLIVAPFDGVCSTEFCVIKAKNKSDQFYLFYLLAQDKFIEYATTNSVGARPRTKWALFSDYEVKEFSSPVKIDIGEILLNYDNIIENNGCRIQLLEEFARLLYKEWFVHLRFPGHEHVKITDGVPEGWEKLTAYDVMDVLSGGTPKTKVAEYWDGEIPFFTPKDTTDCAFTYSTEKMITEQGLSKCNSRLYPKYALFITARGTVGKLSFAQRAMAINQSCYALVAKEDINQQFLYCSLKASIEQFKTRASGAVFDAIVVDTFKLIPFLKPTPMLIEQFTDSVKVIFEQVDQLSYMNRKLAEARDILLPRLMNGELTV